jgi:hypothetical protein
MDRLGFFFGVVAIAISIVPGVADHSSFLASLLFWLGTICVIWGGCVLLRTYIDFSWIWNAINGHYSLQKELSLIEKYGPRIDERELLRWLETMACTNRGTIYGELESDKFVVPIPPAYFRTHFIIYPSTLGPYTHNKENLPSYYIEHPEQNDRYFNLHIDRYLQRIIREKNLPRIIHEAAGESGSPKPPSQSDQRERLSTFVNSLKRQLGP